MFVPSHVSATSVGSWTMDLTFLSWAYNNPDNKAEGWHWLPFNTLEWFIMSGDQDFCSPGIDAFISSKYLDASRYSIDVAFEFGITQGVPEILSALQGLSLPEDLREGFQNAGLTLSEHAYVAPYAPAANRWRITDGSEAYFVWVREGVSVPDVRVYSSNSDWEGMVVNPNYADFIELF